MASSKNSFSTHQWWKESVIYQIYPASFKSTGSGNAPGWGDIKGITSKLDYLKHLGIDIVWVSPIYKSPQIDMGYDISDYTDIDPAYGTLSDVDELIKGLKDRDMKLMMDLVVNHTSDQHAWFQDSRSSKSSSKRDWYIWQPPKFDADGNRKPPNNWSLILGEANSAWTWDEATQEYFLSLFTPEQPDLNWRNPAVRKAVHDVLRFWLERGASGFRMDVINLISKVEGYPDADVADDTVPYQPGHALYANGPELHNYLKEMNHEVLSKYDAITVGEMPWVDDPNEILRAVGSQEKELNMIFIFELVDIDNVPGSFRLTTYPWKISELRRIVGSWQTTMQEQDGWNSVFIENHDNPRSVSRYCDDSDQYRDLSAKLLSLMQTTLSGTLYVYQGEELGIKNLPLSVEPDEYKDIETQNYFKKMNAAGQDDKARRVAQRKARDHARTPMQWNSGSNAGFCGEGEQPWMRVNDDYQTCNAEAQAKKREGGELSVLQFWRRGLQQRKEHKDVFVYGIFEDCTASDRKDETAIFAYKKSSEAGEAFLVVLNFSGEEVKWSIPDTVEVKSWATSNYSDSGSEKGLKGSISLRPWEGLLGVLKP